MSRRGGKRIPRNFLLLDTVALFRADVEQAEAGGSFCVVLRYHQRVHPQTEEAAREKFCLGRLPSFAVANYQGAIGISAGTRSRRSTMP